VKKLLFSFIYCIAFFSHTYAFNTQTLPLLYATGGSDTKTIDPLSTEEGFISLDHGSIRASNEPEIVIPSSNEISVYIVREGDTIQTIAKLFNVSPNTIIWANDLRKKTIKEGDTLVILPINGIRHTIKKGDTIKSVAKLYSADITDIELFNGLIEHSTLTIGETLIVPEGEIVEPVVKKVVAKTPTKAKTVTSNGYFIRPLVGGIRTQGVHGQNGVDIAASIGTSVRASAQGTVILAKNGGYNGGYGNYIVIQHPNGTQTLYAHLSAVYVNQGQTVGQGVTIGAVGNSGRSSGPHLHFEIRNGPRNPF
jgi:murein DD-endopeptidase MepM/ murein hydrolase activator NlpD